jgi:hypothetical protein
VAIVCKDIGFCLQRSDRGLTFPTRGLFCIPQSKGSCYALKSILLSLQAKKKEEKKKKEKPKKNQKQDSCSIQASLRFHLNTQRVLARVL